MKAFPIVALLLLAGMVWAKPPFERPPVVFFRDGNLAGSVGHDVRVTLQESLEKTGDAIRFDGVRSLCRFSIPWLYPDKPLSTTYVVDAVIDKLPETGGILAGRPGFHNALGVRADGRVTFSCFGRDGKTGCQAVSKQPLTVGKRHRIAGVMDCSAGNRTRLTLYIDGVPEGSAELPMPPREYGRAVFLGGLGMEQGKAKSPLACTVYHFRFFYKPLNRSEICHLPGAVLQYRALASLEGEERAWKLAEIPDSVTVSAKLSVDQLPRQDGVIAGRPGFDNALGLGSDGRFYFTVWNAARNDSVKIFSTTKAKPGVE